MKLPNKQFKGDTIVEVMMSLAILAIVIVTTYALSNRAFQSGLNSQYRDQAVSYAQQQIELIKEADNNTPSTITDITSHPDTVICIDPAKKVVNTSSCVFDKQYTVSTLYDSSHQSIKVTVSWDSASTVKQSTVLFYKPSDSFKGPSVACKAATDPGCTSILTDVPAILVYLTSPSTGAPVSQINIGDNVIVGWNYTNVNGSTCSATVGPGGFKGQNVTANSGSYTTTAISPEGPYNFTIACNDLAGNPVTPSTAPLTVIKPTPVVSTGNATAIKPFSATLNGTVDPDGFSTTYQFKYGLTTAYGLVAPTPATNIGTTVTNNANAPISTLTPGTTYHYQLCATNSYGPSCGNDASFTTTNPLPTASLSASSSTVAYGGSTVITTNMTFYTSCSLTGGDSGWAAFKYSDGAKYTTTALYSSTTYWMTCTGPGGSSGPARSDIKVNPAPIPTASLSASSSSVAYGGSTVITTTMTNTTSCTLTGGDSGWAAFAYSNGAKYTTTALYSSTTYWMTCTGPGGTTPAASSAITVNPLPTASLSASSTTVDYGGSTVITTNMTNFTSCALTGGDSGWAAFAYSDGAKYTSTALYSSTTYWMTCKGPGGTTPAASSAITVNPAPAATIDFKISNGGGANIYYGGGVSRKLSWTTTNATKCDASGSWSGSVATSNPSNITTVYPNNSFTLTCYNVAGDKVSSTININYIASSACFYSDTWRQTDGYGDQPACVGEGVWYPWNPSVITHLGSADAGGIMAVWDNEGYCIVMGGFHNMTDWSRTGVPGNYDWDQSFYWDVAQVSVGRDCNGY